MEIKDSNEGSRVELGNIGVSVSSADKIIIMIVTKVHFQKEIKLIKA